jgi:hypothetical protein
MRDEFSLLREKMSNRSFERIFLEQRLSLF